MAGAGRLSSRTRAKEPRDVLIENLFRGGRRLGVGPNINTAPMPPFGPAIPFQLPVAGADCIGIYSEATSQFASARKPVTRAQVAAENGQDNLSHELTINGDFAARREPEPHE